MFISIHQPAPACPCAPGRPRWPANTLARRLVIGIGAALALDGCGDDCGDGEHRDAEICFNKHVLEVSPEAAGPLTLRAADFDGDGLDVVEVLLPELNGDGRADIVVGLFLAGGLAIRISGP